MTKRRQKSAPFPSREDILRFIRESPTRVGRREIARAFRLGAGQRTLLKQVLRDMEEDGSLPAGRGRRAAQAGVLPAVAVVEITGTDMDGEVLARPLAWEDDAPPPVIYMAPEKPGRPALGPGDRVLARLARVRDAVSGGLAYEGRTIRRIAARPAHVLGVYETGHGHGLLRSTDRRNKDDFVVAPGDSLGAQPGDLVRAKVLPGRRLGPRRAQVIERLEKTGGPGSISLITIHECGIPTQFTDEALKQAAAAGAAPPEGRDDLRDVPLITIDDADARDFDDAVWAGPDSDAGNPGGWHLLVAIADVAWYVRPGDALDSCAYERGNSVYLPDRVVPMLPEALSNGWCSLNPGEDRPCLAAHLWIDADGAPLRHAFVRATMRSAARLTYAQVQAACDGMPDDDTAPLVETVVRPLYGAYGALAKARKRRGVLELDMPERRVVVDAGGVVTGIEIRPRHDSHRLIEEFMVAANVAAAETLAKAGQPCMHRNHDAPPLDKLEALRQFLDGLGLKLARGQVVKASQFNRILAKASALPQAHMVNEVVLRSQAQAEYSPGNIGHFGLALKRYCHFTSPIRRYADLLVHRALIRGAKLGAGGLEAEPRDFTRMGEHMSQTERRAQGAERDAVDRFTAAYLADRVGAVFAGRINGVTRFGLFVTLSESGADGLVPARTLPADTYIHDAARHCLRGRRTGREYRLGEEVEVRLTEADPLTGGMVFHLMDAGAPRRGRARIRPAGNGGRKRRPAAATRAPAKPRKKGTRRG